MKHILAYGFCVTLSCVAANALAADKAMKVNLVQQNASGEKGTVTLKPQGDKTEVVIKIDGAPSGVSQPAHIHDGNCANLDPKPRVPLQNVVDGSSTTTLDMKMSDVIGKGGAVNVHKSAQEVKTYVACGDLK